MSAGGTRAIEVLRVAGVPFALHEYEAGRHPSAAGRDHGKRPGYGLRAAAALAVDPDRIFKTLIATVDGRLVAALVPVSAELDLKRLGDALGGRRAALAETTLAERSTGYVVGGISPLGQRRALPTVIDESATVHAAILVSAGRRGLQVEMAPGDLIRLTGAQVAGIARH